MKKYKNWCIFYRNNFNNIEIFKIYFIFSFQLLLKKHLKLYLSPNDFYVECSWNINQEYLSFVKALKSSYFSTDFIHFTLIWRVRNFYQSKRPRRTHQGQNVDGSVLALLEPLCSIVVVRWMGSVPENFLFLIFVFLVAACLPRLTAFDNGSNDSMPGQWALEIDGQRDAWKPRLGFSVYRPVDKVIS